MAKRNLGLAGRFKGKSLTLILLSISRYDEKAVRLVHRFPVVRQDVRCNSSNDYSVWTSDAQTVTKQTCYFKPLCFPAKINNC